MAKFYGSVGYINTQESEDAPGVWMPIETERKYYGDITRNSRKWEVGEHLNDNLNINHIVSIVADPFAYANVGAMRYVEFYGAKWKITNVEVQRPRIILTLGGVWNGETT